jgi:hypothetical protein
MEHGCPCSASDLSQGFLQATECYSAGHVFAFGETRPTAIANMVLGLKELHIRGEIRTNVDYTVDLLHVSSTVFVQKVHQAM